VLRITDSVISGSAALSVLDTGRGLDWRPTDLDIYSPNDRTLRMVWYLCHIERYTVTAVHVSSYTGDSAGFRRVVHMEKGTKRIDVIQSTTLSALHPIPYFWASHLMNYITADKFSLAYPTFTDQGRGLLNPVAFLEYRYARPHTLEVLHKYQARGYSFR
ncbi:hypothetical protein OH77DRAFT_1373963, partial [Trametes cingulata]